MFEKAKWISKGTKRDDGSRLFRKSISIEKPVKKAVLNTVISLLSPVYALLYNPAQNHNPQDSQR